MPAYVVGRPNFFVIVYCANTTVRPPKNSPTP